MQYKGYVDPRQRSYIYKMFENQGAWSIDLPEHGVTKSEDSISYLTQSTKERAIRKVMGGYEKKKREWLKK